MTPRWISFLVAAGALASAAPMARADSVLRVRLVSDPTTFDWNIASTDTETPVTMNIMEGLVEFDANMKVKPSLAESWTVSSDQTTYTFKLKAGIKWSDGRTLVADDFVYSWQRLLAPLTAASYAYFLFGIEGAEEFNSGKSTDFGTVGVKALGPTTLQVKLKRPVAYFLQMLTFWVTFPVRKDVVDKYGPSWSQPGKTVVLGPFIPDSYKPQSEIVLRRNDFYHGRKPALDKVILRVINEDSTALNLFKAGQIDYLRPVNFLELADMKSSPAFHVSTYFRTCFVGMNTNKYPFNLPKVRQAVSLAIDRAQIGKVLHRDMAAADSLMQSEIFPQGKGEAPAYDPVAAKKLLVEALGENATIPSVEFLTYSSDETALIAQFIQDQLHRNLGLNLTISMPEYSMYRAQLQLQSSFMFYRCWAADYADPDTYFSIFLSASGNNFTAWKSPAYDDLVRKAAATASGPERTKMYKDALELLLRKEAPINPLFYDNLTYLLAPRVKGFVINPLNYVFFRDVAVE